MSSCDYQSVDVYDSHFESAIKVPCHLVHQLPHAYLNITRLVLCRNYNPKIEGSCDMGARCKFVHADLSDKAFVHTSSVHVNYAWKDLESVRYPRLPAGEILQVTAPNNRPPTDDIPSEFILKTKRSLAWQTAKGPLSHCAHFHFNRTCNRGEDCNFIHAVYIDPEAGDFKRAPSKTQRVANDPRKSAGVCPGSTPPTATPHESDRVTTCKPSFELASPVASQQESKQLKPVVRQHSPYFYIPIAE